MSFRAAPPLPPTAVGFNRNTDIPLAPTQRNTQCNPTAQVFTGKDASVALGKSSLKPEDAIADYSRLDESEMGVLNDWFKYFEKVRPVHPPSHRRAERALLAVGGG